MFGQTDARAAERVGGTDRFDAYFLPGLVRELADGEPGDRLAIYLLNYKPEARQQRTDGVASHTVVAVFHCGAPEERPITRRTIRSHSEPMGGGEILSDTPSASKRTGSAKGSIGAALFAGVCRNTSRSVTREAAEQREPPRAQRTPHLADCESFTRAWLRGYRYATTYQQHQCVRNADPSVPMTIHGRPGTQTRDTWNYLADREIVSRLDPRGGTETFSAYTFRPASTHGMSDEDSRIFASLQVSSAGSDPAYLQAWKAAVAGDAQAHFKLAELLGTVESRSGEKVSDAELPVALNGLRSRRQFLAFASERGVGDASYALYRETRDAGMLARARSQGSPALLAAERQEARAQQALDATRREVARNCKPSLRLQRTLLERIAKDISVDPRSISIASVQNKGTGCLVTLYHPRGAATCVASFDATGLVESLNWCQ